MAKIKVELDGKTLHAAKDVAEQLGFDLESVTRAFYRQMVREQRIPLDLSLNASAEPALEAQPVESATEDEPKPTAGSAPKKDEPKPAGEKAAAEDEKTPPAASNAPVKQEKHAAPKPKVTTFGAGAGTAPAGAAEKPAAAATNEPARDENGVPPLSSIPSEDELLERMIAARDEADEERQNAEAVKRDAERRAKMQAEMDRAFDEAAAKRKAEREQQEQARAEAEEKQRTAAAEQARAARQAAQSQTQRQAAAQAPRPMTVPGGFPHDAGAFDRSGIGARPAAGEQQDDEAKRLADAFAAVRAAGQQQPRNQQHDKVNEHSEQPLTIDKDGNKHGGWRDSWLFEGDDPNDELLFSPWEI